MSSNQALLFVLTVIFALSVNHSAAFVASDENVTLDDQPLPDTVSFNDHVRSILSENCFHCHGPDPKHREADLRLDTQDGFLTVLEPGSLADSVLYDRITSKDEYEQMPPPQSGRSLSKREKKMLAKWIRQGAAFEDHWAFTAPTRPKTPNVTTKKDWPHNPIDHFVLHKLEQLEVAPSPRAEPHVIVRRLYLDLIGMPPTPTESKNFLAQYNHDSTKAINELIDQLLASPHYGERMSLPWLDAARYSDSNGFQEDGDRAQWPWRDWVVRAMNQNMPFDQFTIEQLAGDLLPNPTQDQKIATGFNRNHMLNGEGGAIAEEQRNNYVFDRVDATATTWLGLTMACAQCHDHKYDPITHTDYYRMFAYFNNINERGGVDRRAGRQQCAQPYITMPTDQQTQSLNEIKKQLQPLRDKLTADKDAIVESMRAWEQEARQQKAPENMNRNLFNILVKLPKERNEGEEKNLQRWFLQNIAEEPWKTIQSQVDKLQSEKNKTEEKILAVMVMRERKNRRQTFVLDRGNYETRLQKVTAGVPAFLPGLEDPKDSNRLDFARWLVDPKNPLTSRVQVNRYWQLFFGTGIVKTVEDFGVQSELPSHPDLLDWLAVEFRESGWDVKHMHRLIVTSSTYLQSSKFRHDLKEADPENRLLARNARFRLPSMLIRDSSLKVSGLLNDRVGGPPVYPWQPGQLWKEFSLNRFSYRASKGGAKYRRGLYTFWRRTVPPPNMFDASNRQTCSVRVSRTNTPLHALTLLNDPTYVEAACFLAFKVLSEDKRPLNSESLTRVFNLAIGRTPSETELKSLEQALSDSHEYFVAQPEQAQKFLSVIESVEIPEDSHRLANLASLSAVAHIVMNTDEFITRQ